MSNYSVFDAGQWQNLEQHVFEYGPIKAPGKVFLSEKVDSSGCEVSLNRLEAGQSYPFLHRHNRHEEVFIAVSGRGDMQVDGEIIPFNEGTVIRIAPEGVRSIRSSAEEPLCFLCIQATAGSLSSRFIGDGETVPGEVRWDGPVMAG